MSEPPMGDAPGSGQTDESDGLLTACRLTMIVSENATVAHRPLYAELVHRAHRFGLHGASVFRGIEGYGASRRVHTSRVLSLTEDLPVAVVVVDERTRLEAFLAEADPLLDEGVTVLEDVAVYLPSARRAVRRGHPAW